MAKKKSDLNKIVARQGDLSFMRVEKQDLSKGQKLDTSVMARGEATGHTHRIAPQMNAFLFMIGTQMYLRAQEKTQLIHEEHTNEIVLPPGDYLIKRQQEYTPSGWVQTTD